MGTVSVTLEQRLSDNYYELTDQTLYKDVNEFLEQHPDPEKTPLNGTIGLKMITKVVSRGLRKQELQGYTGTEYTPKVLTAALAYATEAIKRIEEGTAKQEDFDQTERSVQIMRGHLYRNAAKFQWELAKKTEHNEQQLMTARDHYTDSIRICATYDPSMEAYTCQAKAELELELALKTGNPSWFQEAMDDYENASEKLEKYDFTEALQCRQKKAGILMLAAQADTTPKTQLKLMLNAWNDLQHTANGYRMIKDETAEKDMITAAQAVRAAISVSTKQQQKDDLEQICSEYWEKAEIMTEKDVLIGLEMYEIVSELALMLGHHRDENAELWYNTARDTAELCVQYGKNTLMTAKIAEASLSIADLYGGTKKLPYLMRAQTDYIKAADTIREQDNKLSAQMNRTVFKIIKEIEHIKKKHRQAVYKGKSRTNSPKDPTIAKKTRKRGRRSKRSERLFKPEHELS